MEKEGKRLRRFLESSALGELELPGQPLVELCGRNRVLIEGHCGVKEYSPERIRVSVRYGAVMVCGCNLELRCMSRHQLLILGNIQGITLQGRNGIERA